MIEQLHHTYSHDVYDQKIGILGNYPPPLGGVSVHIARVMNRFRTQRNNVKHFDSSVRGNLVLYVIGLCFFLIKNRFHAVYYHTLDLNSRLIEFTLIVMLKRILRFKLIVVEHNCRHLYTRSCAYKKRLSKLLQYVDHLVLIGHATHTSYTKTLVKIPCYYTIEAAFLPPDTHQETAIMNTYDPAVSSFFDTHSNVIVANAYQLTLLEGKDLYGFDQCIALLARIKHHKPTIGLLLVLGQVGDEAYYALLRKAIVREGVEKSVLFVVGQKELWPLIKRCSLFVRPTLSDAESVSVQEALYFNIPVIASDVCIRPQGVITYKTGNGDDLYDKFNQYRDYLHAQ